MKDWFHSILLGCLIFSAEIKCNNSDGFNINIARIVLKTTDVQGRNEELKIFIYILIF